MAAEYEIIVYFVSKNDYDISHGGEKGEDHAYWDVLLYWIFQKKTSLLCLAGAVKEDSGSHKRLDLLCLAVALMEARESWGTGAVSHARRQMA